MLVIAKPINFYFTFILRFFVCILCLSGSLSHVHRPASSWLWTKLVIASFCSSQKIDNMWHTTWASHILSEGPSECTPVRALNLTGGQITELEYFSLLSPNYSSCCLSAPDSLNVAPGNLVIDNPSGILCGLWARNPLQ